MTILNFQLNRTGDVGVVPGFVFFDTDNTVDEVTTAGYLNKFVAQGNVLSESDMAVVTTRVHPSSRGVSVNLFNISYSSGDWSLTSNSTPLTLSNGQIFVGNAANVAIGVTMSGDATVSSLGVLTIANNAITTAKIANANVTLAKLAAGITPASVVKFSGKQANGGGSATVAITVTGALSSDIVFAQIQASTNAVTVQKVTPTTDTVTVLLSGDPGAATVISYQLLRAAS